MIQVRAWWIPVLVVARTQPKSACGAEPPLDIDPGLLNQRAGHCLLTRWKSSAKCRPHRRPPLGGDPSTNTVGHCPIARPSSPEERARRFGATSPGSSYITHVETKALGPDGQPCKRDTIGILSRRQVHAGRIVTIGKEANRVDDRASGLAQFSNADRLLVTYAEPQDLPWDEMLALARQR